MCRFSSSFTTMNPTYGPPNCVGIPQACPSPMQMSKPCAPGGGAGPAGGGARPPASRGARPPARGRPPRPPPAGAEIGGAGGGGGVGGGGGGPPPPPPGAHG